MKIALVCPYDWSRPGGVRGHIDSLARQLRAEHEVRIFAPVSGSTVDPDVVGVGRAVGVPFNQSVVPVALSPMALRRTRRAVAAFDPHVVHLHEPLAPMVGPAAAGSDAPTVGTFHSWSARRSTLRAYQAISPFGRRVVRNLDVLVAVSPAARDYASSMLRLPLGLFRIVPNGVDVDRFAAAEPIPELLDPERPLLLFVGRLESRKGLEVLIRAFLRLRPSVAGLRLCVVGEGAERDRCQHMVPPSVRPDVLFVGRVSDEELPRYHASADVFVSPATGGESFGIVLLEAMAAGLPVVASDIPGYRTVMKDGHQGRLFRSGDALALADTLESVVANPRLRAAMADQGRATAAAYAWPVVTRQIVEVYREARKEAGGG